MPMLEILVSMAIALGGTLLLTPRWIRVAKRRGLVGKDMNKPGKPEVAETGGVVVFTSFLLTTLFYIGLAAASGQEGVLLMLASIVSVSIITAIAYMDDISGWKKGFVRWKKPIITVVAVIPLIPFLLDRTTLSIMGNLITLPWLFYPLLMVPIGFIVATNAVNLLGGFNGLEASLGIIGLSTLAWFAQATPFLPVLLIAISCLIGFVWFNRFPSRVFPGDTLTYFIGTLFAVVAVMGYFQTITIMIMAPYIIEGAIKSRELHYIYRNKKIFKPECFGMPCKDSSLKEPYPQIWSLTHLAMKLIRRAKGRCYENDVTILFLGIYALWCLGIIWMFG
jgi:UDP-N-acetylglucosamine--dolichyl-phosphate N-acetylglucosaminephosphotransferase